MDVIKELRELRDSLPHGKAVKPIADRVDEIEKKLLEAEEGWKDHHFAVEILAMLRGEENE